MSRCPSRRRTTATAAVLVALALAASGCGGSDPKATDDPTGASSATTTPTPTPTPTPSEAPLSPFEDRPQVKSLRAFFVAVGRAVNAGETDLHSIRALTTPAGLESTRGAVQGDLDNGYQWPGPEPFTPTAVRSRAGSATVSTCMLSTGWSVDPRTGKVVGGKKAHSVKPILFNLKKAAGRWKVDAVSYGTGDCASVEVKEVRW